MNPGSCVMDPRGRSLVTLFHGLANSCGGGLTSSGTFGRAALGGGFGFATGWVTFPTLTNRDFLSGGAWRFTCRVELQLLVTR